MIKISGQFRYFFVLHLFILISFSLIGQHSVARKWNNELLNAIRIDLARPTVHARNLFHSSVVMFDAWAAYDAIAKPFLLGSSINDFVCPFEGISVPVDKDKAREEVISYAMYRLLSHRFKKSPGANQSLKRFSDLMIELGYDTANRSVNYTSQDPAALGNYIAQCMINFGLQDGSNEISNYQNLYYAPINPALEPAKPGNPTMIDPNRWQPLRLDVFIDQSGNPIPGSIPPFLSAEWGNVVPFSMNHDDLKIFTRSGDTYKVYKDPGPPPYLGQTTDEEYKWNMSLVSAWSSHMDPADDVMWDISPASIGNNKTLPNSFEEYKKFYKLRDGGDSGEGWLVNPKTGLPYQSQIVHRGDYTRVLAEFWADGPTSETPPGHWFTILNYVSDHPLFVKKFRGQGTTLGNLEWDVKAYFALGGAVHDAAIAAWSIKGCYDYVRPISGLRYMADLGQSSNSALNNYNVSGIPLLTGLIEQVLAGDPLEGSASENAGKIKLRSWRGPDFVVNPETDIAGVDWILAENWWPYQRPTFVTPPFAGYISGHSTFSRAAAEVLTLLTGDPFFPGGMSEFVADKNSFLVFEEGPSTDITLQWATYRDASDQTSLSRIWGGIHVPADDIAGRKIGAKIGVNAFSLAEKYFDGLITSTEDSKVTSFQLYPNPTQDFAWLEVNKNTQSITIKILDMHGACIKKELYERSTSNFVRIDLHDMNPGLYLVQITVDNTKSSQRLIVN